MTEENVVEKMGSVSRATYRFTYNQLVDFLIRVANSPNMLAKEMKNFNYDRWIFARDAGLAHENRDRIELTRLGEEFLVADNAQKKSIFRAALLNNDQFSAIWIRIQEEGMATGVIGKKDLERIIKAVLGTTSDRMATIYAGRIANWARNADLMTRTAGMRAATYKIRTSSHFGDMISVVNTIDAKNTIPIATKESVPESCPTILREIYVVLNDILIEPEDVRLQDELRLLASKWKHQEYGDEISPKDKELLLNDIELAIEIKQLRAFQAVAKALRIIRKERGQQKDLSQFLS